MSFRPKKFSDIIGNQANIEVMKICVDSALRRNEPLGHLLLSGPPGTGKTSFCNVLAEELGVSSLKMVNGATFRSPKVIVPYLMKIQEGDILFIDEIHRMTKIAEEFLYPVMEDFKLNIVVGEDKIISTDLPKFTILGATTELGSLSPPLRDRFKLKFELELYNVKDLSKLIYINAKKLSINIEKEAIISLAGASRGTPRIANALLEWIRDYGVAKNLQKIGAQDVKKALNLRKIGLDGSTEDDRKYVKFLKQQKKPIGLKTISSSLNIESETIEAVIEPFLLRRGKIMIGAGGRTYIKRQAMDRAFEQNEF